MPLTQKKQHLRKLKFPPIRLFMTQKTPGLLLRRLLFQSEYAILVSAMEDRPRNLGKELSLMKKNWIAAAAACLTACVCCAPAASAATLEDVAEAARAMGYPELCIQEGINYCQTSNYTPEQYDQIVAAVYENNDEIWNVIYQEYGIEAPAETESSSSGADETENSGESADPAQPQFSITTTEFLALSMEEQKAFLQSLTAEEQSAFLGSLTPQERNAILKQLSTDAKAQVLSQMVEAGASMGLHFTVEELTDESLTLSVRGEDGTLVDVSSVGIVVDDTGISHTGLILGAGAVLLLSAGGLLLLSLRTKKEQTYE